MQNPVSLLQISTPDQKVYLFHVKKIGLPKHLLKIFESRKLLKVGVAIHDDRNLLVRYKKHKPKGYIELSNITTNQLNIVNRGASALSLIVLGFRISKKMQRSNWDNDTLSQEQQVYAATDAWICTEMFTKLVINGIINFNTVNDYIVK